MCRLKRYVLLACWFSIGSFAACSRLSPPVELPVASSLILDELVIYSDFQLPGNHRLLRDLEQMRARMTTALALPPSSEPVEVYLFKTPRRYQRFLDRRYPQFPDRRAFFVQTDTRLCVYTYWGDHIAEDLCHEVCHGYLHAVVPRIPLWIDEGLAEFYECDRGKTGWNPSQAERLIAARTETDWQPDLERLERRTQTEDLTEIDYAEAWLWTHFLLRTTDLRREMLQDYLANCRLGTGDVLSQKLRKIEPDSRRQLLLHLEQLCSNDILAP